MGLIYSMIAANLNLKQSDNETEVPEIFLPFFFFVFFSDGIQRQESGGGPLRHHSHCNTALKCQR